MTHLYLLYVYVVNYLFLLWHYHFVRTMLICENLIFLDKYLVFFELISLHSLNKYLNSRSSTCPTIFGHACVPWATLDLWQLQMATGGQVCCFLWHHVVTVMTKSLQDYAQLLHKRFFSWNRLLFCWFFFDIVNWQFLLQSYVFCRRSFFWTDQNAITPPTKWICCKLITVPKFYCTLLLQDNDKNKTLTLSNVHIHSKVLYQIYPEYLEFELLKFCSHMHHKYYKQMKTNNCQ